MAGTKVLTKHGQIESTGNKQVFPHSSVVNGITFDDGESIRHVVQVESSIASWLSPGVEGTFVFTQGPGKVLMLVAVGTEKGLRVANPRFATHLTAEAAGHITWYGLATLICVSLVGLIGPLAIIAAPAFISFVVLVVKASTRIGPHSAFRRVVNVLDRTRQLPTNARDSVAATALAA